MDTVFSIGHSNHAIEDFLEVLHRQGIECLVDVRSQPFSRRFPRFARRPLERSLAAAGIDYRFLGDRLGGRPAGPGFYRADGKVDYVRRALAEDFVAGVEELRRLAAVRPTVMMCAEEDPARCHRRLLVAPALVQRGLQVVHLRGDGRRETAVDARQPGLFD